MGTGPVWGHRAGEPNQKTGGGQGPKLLLEVG